MTFSGESPGDLLTVLQSPSLSHPTLGLIFSSVALDIRSLAAACTTLPFPVIGCSSAGEICTGREDPISELSATGVLCDMDPGSFAVRIFHRDEGSSEDMGRAIGTWGITSFTRPGFIVLVSGLTNDGEVLMQGIREVCEEPPFIAGALAGDDGRHEETMVFLNEAWSSDGVVAIALDQDRFDLHTLVTGGWQGVGAHKLITRSSKNRVYAIDHRPIFDIYREYLQIRDEDIPALTVSFPLIITREDGTEIIRTPLSVDREEGALIFAGSVPEGSRVRFASSPGYTTIQNSIREIQEYSGTIQSADLLLLFSCMARYQMAGSHAGDEITAASVIGNVPIVGFFSYGEMGTDDNGHSDFHNETFTLLTIRERDYP